MKRILSLFLLTVCAFAVQPAPFSFLKVNNSSVGNWYYPDGQDISTFTGGTDFSRDYWQGAPITCGQAGKVMRIEIQVYYVNLSGNLKLALFDNSSSPALLVTGSTLAYSGSYPAVDWIGVDVSGENYYVTLGQVVQPWVVVDSSSALGIKQSTTGIGKYSYQYNSFAAFPTSTISGITTTTAYAFRIFIQ
jgi:hypothetical protein